MLNASPTEIGQMRKTFLEQLKEAKIGSSGISAMLSGGTDDCLALVSAVAPACWSYVSRHTRSFDGLVEELNQLARQLPILESSRFDDMLQRETSITEVFAQTYAWIFDHYVSPLAKWLEGGQETFWVSGKPGSGKSTLMKFTTQQGDTRRMLKTRAAGRRSVQSKHFFWGTGTALQKSYQGLLQGLVFHTLRNCPDLIQHVCGHRWAETDARRLLPDQWGVQELRDTLRRAFEHDEAAMAFCIFIDGLDEFAEDHFTLITDLVECHARKPNVKFCVSSRPYNVFKTALHLENIAFDGHVLLYTHHIF